MLMFDFYSTSFIWKRRAIPSDYVTIVPRQFLLYWVDPLCRCHKVHLLQELLPRFDKIYLVHETLISVLHPAIQASHDYAFSRRSDISWHLVFAELIKAPIFLVN